MNFCIWQWLVILGLIDILFVEKFENMIELWNENIKIFDHIYCIYKGNYASCQGQLGI